MHVIRMFQIFFGVFNFSAFNFVIANSSYILVPWFIGGFISIKLYGSDQCNVHISYVFS